MKTKTRKATPIEILPGSVLVRVTPGLAELIEEGHKRIKTDRDVRRERIEFTKLTLYAKLEKHVASVVDECLSVARRRKLMKRKRKPKAALATEAKEVTNE